MFKTENEKKECLENMNCNPENIHSKERNQNILHRLLNKNKKESGTNSFKFHNLIKIEPNSSVIRFKNEEAEVQRINPIMFSNFSQEKYKEKKSLTPFLNENANQTQILEKNNTNKFDDEIKQKESKNELCLTHSKLQSITENKSNLFCLRNTKIMKLLKKKNSFKKKIIILKSCKPIMNTNQESKLNKMYNKNNSFEENFRKFQMFPFLKQKNNKRICNKKNNSSLSSSVIHKKNHLILLHRHINSLLLSDKFCYKLKYPQSFLYITDIPIFSNNNLIESNIKELANDKWNLINKKKFSNLYINFNSKGYKCEYGNLLQNNDCMTTKNFKTPTGFNKSRTKIFSNSILSKKIHCE